MTLLELSVGMMLFSVIAAVVGAVTVASLSAARTAATRTSMAADARIAMEGVSRTLRVAVVPERVNTALTVAQPDAMTFYALLNRSGTSDPLPTMVEYYRDATKNCLMQALTPARLLSPTSDTDPLYAWDTGRRTKCLVRTTQVPSVSSPWFSYYTNAALTSGGSTVAPLAASASNLSLADRQDVVSVEFRLMVTDPANPTVKGVFDLVRVTLSNVSLADGGTA